MNLVVGTKETLRDFLLKLKDFKRVKPSPGDFAHIVKCVMVHDGLEIKCLAFATD